MAEGDYEVGYGKPPKSSQFAKGKSGNPGGKRKRPLTLREEILRQLDRRVPVPMKNGKTKGMSVRELVATRLAQLAAESHLGAIKLIFQMEDAGKTAILSEEGAVPGFTIIFDNEKPTLSISEELLHYYEALDRGERPPRPFPR